MSGLAVITVGLDPYIELGPVRLAWHGLTIAIGVLVGGWLAARWLRERGLRTEPLTTMAVILMLGALLGGRAFYLLEHGRLADWGAWSSSRGFTFDGGFIAAAVGLTVYLWRASLPLAYLDAVAAGLPLGVAVGRIGDVINGEHYGPATTFLLGVRNTNPAADTPSTAVAYHSGGLYEVLLGLAVFAIVWPMRGRLATRPLRTTFTVLALFSIGRFFEFFLRSDSPAATLGLNSAQWTSLALLAVAVAGLVWSHRRAPVAGPEREFEREVTDGRRSATPQR